MVSGYDEGTQCCASSFDCQQQQLSVFIFVGMGLGLLYGNVTFWFLSLIISSNNNSIFICVKNNISQYPLMDIFQAKGCHHQVKTKFFFTCIFQNLTLCAFNFQTYVSATYQQQSYGLALNHMLTIFLLYPCMLISFFPKRIILK